MPDSFDGLGGPAFYFYPPLAFWLDGVVSLVTFNLLSVSHRLTLDGWLLLWASGLAMHAWLSTETGRARVALWGALAYVAAPYHLLVDHYIRGAFAEGAAYAFVPLVMLGIRQMTGRRRYALLVLALAYGGLLLSHLPTALLVSTTVLPAYAIFRTRDAAMLLRPGRERHPRDWPGGDLSLAGGNATRLDLGRPAVDPLLSGRQLVPGRAGPLA